ncbi:DUF2007 domain-containing protein [Vibrio marisflavi]|uniref:RanBP2-type domain-containing protein n=1 Tax=Vibrio marisflavi CECT 7928 TaxID=634439 RepID=A0ABM9A673_9VIBR|nr:DUF2007 domain-containing protein [Vibrio marisflavi]CAH0540548.1 hypothetical protein VMF7928_02949 [Vibrio marisflavi CECT 7928]
MKIFIARNPTEAHIVCELLRSEHVACEVRGEGLFGLQGELPFGDDTDAYIWLLNTYHEKKAVTIVQEYQSRLNRNENNADWYCSGCGEQNEGQFAICWSCGAAVTSSE